MNSALLRRLRKIRESVRVIGTGNAAVVEASRGLFRVGLKLPFKIRLRPNDGFFPLELRLGTSDADVFRQIFVERQYARAFIQDFCPSLIVDCGANAGYSSAFFLASFPDCRVIAVEPEPLNAALCAANLTLYGSRAIVINAAIWGHCCDLSIDRDAKDQSNWAIRVRPAELGQSAIPALDIPEIMRLAGTEHIDLLKIDVEGSETDLFTDSCHAWLPKVRNLSIELHGPESGKVFYSAMARYTYELEQCGEIVNCRNISPIAIYNGRLPTAMSSAGNAAL